METPTRGRDMTTKVAIATLAVAVALAVAPTDAGACRGSSSSSDTTTSTVAPSDFTLGKKAVDASDYEAAVEYLIKAVQQDPRNAEGYNLLGFSYRKLGDVETAFEHYKTALRIDPDHRGTNEYIGELYLETGNLAKAEEHLEALDNACFFGCPEYRELKSAVKAYKASHGG